MDYRFNNHYVSGHGKPNALDAGSLVHVILENFYKAKRDGIASPTLVGIDAGYQWLQQNEHPNLPEENELTNGRIKLLGYKYIFETMDQYFDFWKNDSWTTLETEKVLSNLIYEDDEIRVIWKAKLDWLVDTGQGIIPADHKTRKENRLRLALDNQFIGQCYLTNSRMMVVNNIGFQRSAKPNEKFSREVMPYSADRIDEWKSLVAYYAKYLVSLTEVDFYPPRFTSCNKFYKCQFYDVCNSDRGMRNEILKTDFIIGEPWDIGDGE